MRKTMCLATFVLSAMVFAGAQQPSGAPGSGAPGQSGPQATSPSAGPGQSSGAPGTPGAAGPQATPQAGGAAANAPITEGCLGGTSPNFTLTDTGGKTYKLTLPANADGSKLTPHIGESVQVMGQVSGSSINVSQIGKGTGTCPGK